MKSMNFEILRDGWPELAALGRFAEEYVNPDPLSALVKLRLFAENLTKDIYRHLGLPKPDQPSSCGFAPEPLFRGDHTEGRAQQTARPSHVR